MDSLIESKELTLMVLSSMRVSFFYSRMSLSLDSHWKVIKDFSVCSKDSLRLTLKKSTVFMI
jgi:hypothetical protein